MNLMPKESRANRNTNETKGTNEQEIWTSRDTKENGHAGSRRKMPEDAGSRRTTRITRE